MDWSDVLSGFIGVAGGLGVFYLQTHRDNKKEKKRQYEKNLATIQYLKVSLVKTEITLESYIEILTKFVNDIKANPLVYPNSDYLIFPYAERLGKKIDQNQVFTAIKDKYEILEAALLFSDIYQVVDGINNSLPEIWKSQIETGKQDLVRKQNYIRIVEKNIDYIVKLGLISDAKYGVSFKSDIGNIIGSFFENRKDNTDLAYYQEYFVEVLKEYLISNYISNPELIVILSELRNATDIFESIKQYNLFHCTLVERYIKQFGEILITLKDVLSKLTM